MAAIAATHATARAREATDWRQTVALYNQLAAVWPSPIVALNRVWLSRLPPDGGAVRWRVLLACAA